MAPTIQTAFTVTPQRLSALSASDAVDVVRELIWAEASDMGIGKDLINIPTAITVADGGVDAEVDCVLPRVGQGLIRQGLTRYQIKTGDFPLTSDANAKKLLFTPASLKKGQTPKLYPRIQASFDRGGCLT